MTKLTPGRGDVDKPCQGLSRAFRHRQESQEGETHHNKEAVQRYALLRGVGQDSRSSAFQGEAIKVADGAVSVCVSSREDGRHQETVRHVSGITGGPIQPGPTH